MSSSPGKASPSSKSKSKNNSKMTRAVVANLNRQKSEREGQNSPSPNGSTGNVDNNTHSTPKRSTSSSPSRKPTPHKSLPPQPSPSKELPDIPEFFIVRPAPSTSAAKIERNDRRVFINRTTMEKINVYQGSVVLIQRHDPSKWVPTLARSENEMSQDDDESQYPTDGEEDSVSQTTVGVAWPMDRIEPNVVRMASSLRQSAGLQLSDHVVLSPYRSTIEEAREVILQQEESADAPAEREALRFYLRDELCTNSFWAILTAVQQARYLSVGMRLECAYRGVLRSFIVKGIIGSETPDRSSIISRLENLSLTSAPATNLSTGTVPVVYCMSRATTISFSGSKDVIQSPSGEDEVTFSSIGGLKAQIETLRDMIEMPLLKPHLFVRFGMKPPRGVLLYGPPGTGKTLLLRAIAHETKAHVLTVNGPSVLSKYQGETESTLRSIFAEAYEQQPSIIFIDEIDALAPKRGGENESALDVTDGRVVATLLTLMDGMQGSGRVVVVAATNRPNAIDPALRRPGRFDKELEIGIPDANARLEILRLQLRKMPHILPDTYVQSVAAKTHGYVGADLIALCTEAGMHCIKNGVHNNIPETSMKIDQSNIEAALLVVRASAMREIFLETPKVKWSDIGGQEHVKRKLREAVDWPLSHPHTFTNLGITPPKGLLLYGPPGCSKTLMAKALATETGMNFFAVKGPEVFNKYVGESERTIREIFRKARAASPSIIFFDEIDAMTTSRGSGNGTVNDRILATLLNEMDGIEELVNVTILAATNRPDVIDSALLRPGRIDRILYVGLPDFASRKEIFGIEFRRMKIAADVVIEELASQTEGLSGAEISALCRDAGIQAMYEDLDAKEIQKSHFDLALRFVVRSVGEEQVAFFEEFRMHSGIQSI